MSLFKINNIPLVLMVLMFAGSGNAQEVPISNFSTFSRVSKPYCGEIALFPGVKAICLALSNREILEQCGELRDSGDEVHYVLVYNDLNDGKPWLLIDFVNEDPISSDWSKIVVYEKRVKGLFFWKKREWHIAFESNGIFRDEEMSKFLSFVLGEYGLRFVETN